MKLTELAEKACAVRGKLGKYVNVSSNIACFTGDDRPAEIQYSLYVEGGSHIYYETPSALMAHMEHILNPVEEDLELDNAES